MVNENRSREEKYEHTKKYIERKAVYNVLYRTVLHLLPADMKVQFELRMGGGSHTDSSTVVVGVNEYVWGMPYDKVFSVLKALTGHECEHVRSSDFDLFVKFQDIIGTDFDNFIKTGVVGSTVQSLDMNNGKSQKNISESLSKVNSHKRYGSKLGANLLNSIEDGAIEKILVNRLRGFKKHIQYMNGLVWDKQPVTGVNPLQEFLYSITTMCVTGLKGKNWDEVYGGSDLDQLLNQVRPLVIQGINQPTPLGRAESAYEIYKLIAPKVAELLEQNVDAMDSMTEELNFQSQGGLSIQEGGSGFPENSVSTHFCPEIEINEKDKESEQSDSSHEKTNDNEKANGEDTEESEGSTGSDDSNSSQETGQNHQSQKDENDLTDHSQKRAKKERDLVNDFLKKAEEELETELENDLKQVEQEEKKIQREEEKKAKESGNLTDSELQNVLSGTKVARFTQRKLSLRERKVPEEVLLQGKKLRRQLEKILLDKKDYTSRNRKKGVLDPSAIWKLGIKEYNTFMKKGKPYDSSYVVNVLVDNSYSMTEFVDSKRKIDFATKACGILEEGLKGLVPFRIIRFDNDWSYGVRHLIVSDFGDTEKVNRTYSTLNQIGSANADSISIRIATQELLKRPEQKKILFVLSDGLPSSYDDEDEAINSVRNAVRDARKAGVIVIAICFGSESHLNNTRDSYHKMYQQGIIMTSPENVPAHIVKVLEREIK